MKRQIKKRRSFGALLCQILVYLILCAFGVMIVVPFLIAVVTSLTPELILTEKGFQWFTGFVDIGYYTRVLFSDEFGTFYRCFFNTIAYIMPPLLVGTFCSALAAYAFARINFQGKNVLFALMLATMVIPGIITTFPSYLLFVQVYKVNDWFPAFPLIVPGMFGAVGTMFFLKQYFGTLPRELEEAAELDGLGRFGIFTKIILPLSVPAIITQLLLGFNGMYNDYLGPLLYLGGQPDAYTVQLFVRGLSSSLYPCYPLIMAGGVVALIPTLVLYLAGQKYFVEGIVMTGIK